MLMFRPKYIDLEEDADNLTPENFASFPSKMTFSWFDSFAWTGWKRNFTIYKFAELKKRSWTKCLKNQPCDVIK